MPAPTRTPWAMSDDSRRAWWIIGIGGAVLGGALAGLLVSRRLRRVRVRPESVGDRIGECEALVERMQDQLAQLKTATGS